MSRVVAMADPAPFAPPDGVLWRWARYPLEGPFDPTGPDGAAVAPPPDVAAAVDRRRAEFVAGRACAARALRALGAPETVGRCGRAPVWPDGVRGSISHAAGVAVAAVSRRWAAVGVDCEALMDEATAAAVAPLALTPQDAAARPAGGDPRRHLTTIFSAKEAAYKALSSRLADIPDFREAHVAAFGADRLTLRFRGWSVLVRHGWAGGLCVTLALCA